MTFYHYTCDHGHTLIGEYGALRTIGQRMPEVYQELGMSEDQRLMYSLIWATDLAEPDIEGLGLTKRVLSCERWTHRYRITNPLPLMPYSDMSYRFTLGFQADLVKPPAQPDHWWVSWRPLPVVYDPIEVAA